MKLGMTKENSPFTVGSISRNPFRNLDGPLYSISPATLITFSEMALLLVIEFYLCSLILVTLFALLLILLSLVVQTYTPIGVLSLLIMIAGLSSTLLIVLLLVPFILTSNWLIAPSLLPRIIFLINLLPITNSTSVKPLIVPTTLVIFTRYSSMPVRVLIELLISTNSKSTAVPLILNLIQLSTTLALSLVLFLHALPSILNVVTEVLFLLVVVTAPVWMSLKLKVFTSLLTTHTLSMVRATTKV